MKIVFSCSPGVCTACACDTSRSPLIWWKTFWVLNQFSDLKRGKRGLFLWLPQCAFCHLIQMKFSLTYILAVHVNNKTMSWKDSIVQLQEALLHVLYLMHLFILKVKKFCPFLYISASKFHSMMNNRGANILQQASVSEEAAWISRHLWRDGAWGRKCNYWKRNKKGKQAPGCFPTMWENIFKGFLCEIIFFS